MNNICCWVVQLGSGSEMFWHREQIAQLNDGKYGRAKQRSELGIKKQPATSIAYRTAIIVLMNIFTLRLSAESTNTVLLLFRFRACANGRIACDSHVRLHALKLHPDAIPRWARNVNMQCARFNIAPAADWWVICVRRVCVAGEICSCRFRWFADWF